MLGPPEVPSSAASGLAALPEGVLCPECGYDLRGSTSERCPECGFVLEVLRTSESQIPWSHRGQLGRFRAYWRTVSAVMRSPRRFCLEMARPVDYHDAQSFRWLTALHGYVGLAVTAIAWVAAAAQSGQITEPLVWLLAGILVWLLLMLAGGPGLASYFFQPRRLPTEQQNRAIALSYYAWAPLALLPVIELPLIAIGVLVWVLAASPTDLGEMIGVATLMAGIATAIIAIVVDRSISGFLRGILNGNFAARLFRMMALRALGLLFGLLALFVPLSLFYVVLIIYSLA